MPQPLRLVIPLTLTVSGALALAALLLHRYDAFLGAAAGGLFSMLYYMGLRAYTARLLGQGAGIGGPSWVWTLGRYAAAVVVLALLAKVSVLCLLAALAVHAGSLGILFWTGTRIHDTGNHTG